MSHGATIFNVFVSPSTRAGYTVTRLLETQMFIFICTLWSIRSLSSQIVIPFMHQLPTAALSSRFLRPITPLGSPLGPRGSWSSAARKPKTGKTTQPARIEVPQFVRATCDRGVGSPGGLARRGWQGEPGGPNIGSVRGRKRGEGMEKVEKLRAGRRVNWGVKGAS